MTSHPTLKRFPVFLACEINHEGSIGDSFDNGHEETVPQTEFLSQSEDYKQ